MADTVSVIQTADEKSLKEHGAALYTAPESRGLPHQLPVPVAGIEQSWTSAVALVQGAAAQLRRYDYVLRTMANDIIKITFRSNAEKAELEKALERADEKLATLDADHHLALELLKVTHLLCGSLKSRLEEFEPLPTEMDKDFRRAASYIATLRLSQARRGPRTDGSFARHE